MTNIKIAYIYLNIDMYNILITEYCSNNLITKIFKVRKENGGQFKFLAF